MASVGVGLIDQVGRMVPAVWLMMWGRTYAGGARWG
jgi:hypothetical protein